MSRILDLLASSNAVPTQSDPEFANYNTVEQRLILNSGGSKSALLKLYRRVKGRRFVMSPALAGITVNESTTCTAAATGEQLTSDTLRANGEFGSGLKQRGNELFVGEPKAVGSIFVVGEVHYFTRPNSESSWVRQSGFFSNTQQNGGGFGSEIDYDGSRVIVSETNVARAANVFTFSGGVATPEQEITANTYNDTGGRFSQGVAINGSHALIGAPGEPLGGTNRGGVEYWTESGGTWTFQQAFPINGTAADGQYFGQSIAMVSNAEAYITYCDVANSNRIGVQKWTRSGATWSFDSEFFFDDYTNSATNFARINTDGTSLIIGQDGYDVGTGTNEGVVLVCDLTGTITTEIVGDPGDQIGTGVTIDGTEAVIGYAFNDPSGTSNAGTADVWDVCT